MAGIPELQVTLVDEYVQNIGEQQITYRVGEAYDNSQADTGIITLVQIQEILNPEAGTSVHVLVWQDSEYRMYINDPAELCDWILLGVYNKIEGNPEHIVTLRSKLFQEGLVEDNGADSLIDKALKENTFEQLNEMSAQDLYKLLYELH